MNEERLTRIEELLATEKSVEVDEGEIKELVWYIAVMKDATQDIDDDNILHDVIKLKKCDIMYAKSFLRKMKDLGLGICRGYGGYSMRRFGTMRGYIPNDYFQYTDTEDNHWTQEEKDMFDKFTAEVEAFKKRIFDTLNNGHPMTVRN